MATTAYYHWVADGSPYTDSRPTAHVAANIRRHGYTVYTAGDRDHQMAEPPEDHTAISQSGWPIASAYGVGHAMDVMPPTAAMVARGLPTLAQIGAQMYADKQSALPAAKWLKYVNWEPSGPGGPCVQDSWQPNHQRSSSSDRGHIHVSGRSDMDTSTSADEYDPVQRWLDAKEDDMSLTTVQDQRLAAATTRDEARVKGTPTYDANWTASATDKETSWEIGQLAKVDKILTAVTAPGGSVTLTDADITAIAVRVADLLAARLQA